MISVHIEPLTEASLPACLEIYNYYVVNTVFSLEEAALTRQEYAARAGRVTRRYPFLVAKDGDAVVGFAYLDVFNSRSAYRHTADLSIYVAHDALHRRVGAALLDTIEEAARAQGITTLISLITSENDNSCAFHERNGFVLEGDLHDVAVKFGRQVGVRYYRKRL